MKPRGHLPKHFKQDVPCHHHNNAEGVAEGSVPFQECNGFCRLAWKGNKVLKDWCTNNRLDIQGQIICRRVVIFMQLDKFLTRYIGKLNASDSMNMLKLLHDCFKSLGKILESGLGKAFSFVLEG
jgi:hypothetical protein